MTVAILARVLRLRRDLRHHEQWSRAELMKHQGRALAGLRRFAYERSPFYRRFHGGLLDRPLADLPVLTKAQMMLEFDTLVTDREIRLSALKDHLGTLRDDERYLDRYFVTSTAGSTGLRGILVQDINEWTTVLGSYTRANDWAGIEAGLLHRMKLAVVSSGTPWHQSARVGMSFESRFIPTLRLDAAQPIPTTVSALNEFQPDSLVAYASMTRVLAEEQIAGRLRIAPRAIMSASEVLTVETRERIRMAWNREPFNVYAATEPAGIASECDRHLGLHLYEDLVITEVVDERNRPVPPGELGAKVLVTVLFSRTQPLIRYEMSDSIRLSTRICDCGRPFALVDEIVGRQEDMLILPARSGNTIAVHPNVFHHVLETVPGYGWQVVQQRDVLRVLVAKPGNGFDADGLADALRRELAQHGAVPPPIRVERVEQIPRTPLGKAPLIRALKPGGHP